MAFDPNDTASRDSGLFGLPYPPEECLLHVIPVPWEVTTSYGDGASRGPAAVLRASHQVDLFDIETGDVFRNGYYLEPMPTDVERANREFKAKAKTVLEALETGRGEDPKIRALQNEINEASRRLNEHVYAHAQKILSEERFAAVLGGDHSTPFGLIRALSEKYQGQFGILHVDAHADLREAYQGYEFSHASIMHNVIEKLKVQTLVQVGIRDFSSGEFDFIRAHENIHTYFDQPLKRRQHRGESWQTLASEIVGKLPENVYVSFDIDGLEPELCPNTGTPVPGGLRFEEALTLISTVGESGRRIVGFDLNEVAEPEDAAGDWDGNVGARLLFKLCNALMASNGFKAGK